MMSVLMKVMIKFLVMGLKIELLRANIKSTPTSFGVLICSEISKALARFMNNGL